MSTVAAPVIATSNASGLTISTPTALAELRTVLQAAGPELPRRQEQFLLPLAEREPGYLRLGRVRLIFMPVLVRQILAHNSLVWNTAPESFGGLAGPIEFGGGPLASDRHRRLRVQDVAHPSGEAAMMLREAEALRATVTQLGPSGRSWTLAAEAADLERRAFAADPTLRPGWAS
jgi:hypothetical protein